MSNNSEKSKLDLRHAVHFVGAGPGDPELITVKGKRLLQEADLVIYTGSLVPAQLIAGLNAEIHNSAGLDLTEVFDLILRSWKIGKKIVRLHTGDPSIYGAINEQISLLNEHQIPFNVIPGVSSGTATAAALKTELTLPEVSQTVIFTRRGGRTPVPEKEDLSLLASHGATMMIFLSISMIEDVVSDLLTGGYTTEAYNNIYGTLISQITKGQSYNRIFVSSWSEALRQEAVENVTFLDGESGYGLFAVGSYPLRPESVNDLKDASVFFNHDFPSLLK